MFFSFDRKMNELGVKCVKIIVTEMKSERW